MYPVLTSYLSLKTEYLRIYPEPSARTSVPIQMKVLAQLTSHSLLLPRQTSSRTFFTSYKRIKLAQLPLTRICIEKKKICPTLPYLLFFSNSKAKKASVYFTEGFTIA